jgi:hypothetical protein
MILNHSFQDFARRHFVDTPTSTDGVQQPLHAPLVVM